MVQVPKFYGRISPNSFTLFFYYVNECELKHLLFLNANSLFVQIFVALKNSCSSG
jgi:hypothetical protein